MLSRIAMLARVAATCYCHDSRYDAATALLLPLFIFHILLLLLPLFFMPLLLPRHMLLQSPDIDFHCRRCRFSAATSFLPPLFTLLMLLQICVAYV